MDQVDERIQRHYDFPTKRILLTRDPKDVSRRGQYDSCRVVGGGGGNQGCKVEGTREGCPLLTRGEIWGKDRLDRALPRNYCDFFRFEMACFDAS